MIPNSDLEGLRILDHTSLTKEGDKIYNNGFEFCEASFLTMLMNNIDQTL